MKFSSNHGLFCSWKRRKLLSESALEECKCLEKKKWLATLLKI